MILKKQHHSVFSDINHFIIEKCYFLHLFYTISVKFDIFFIWYYNATMKRHLINMLIEWKNDQNRKPLVLSGARQVGKTWLMNEFGKRYYKKVAYITFFNNARLKKVFENDYDINRLITNISIETNIDIEPDDTLIIFDEIQECPKALESLKYFCEQAREYNIIAAGSLLGVFLHEKISYPVGKVDEMTLYPMTFLEFLEAMGEEKLCKIIFEKNIQLINDFSDRLIELLKQYYYVGGMPEIVSDFVSNKDYNKVREKQNTIINQYIKDFSKHIKGFELTRVNQIWDSIPMQLIKENKKFIFNNIKSGARFKEYDTAIEWLKRSGLIYVVNKVTTPKIPLKAYSESSSFKIFLVDIGLLTAMAELDIKTLLDGNKVFVEFKGALAEQYVAQQLISMFNKQIYYYTSKNSIYEIDFMMSKDNHIMLVEVKSGYNLSSKSVNYFKTKYAPKYVYELSLNNYNENNETINVPLYALNLL